MLHSRIDSLPYPQTLGQGGKACKRQILNLIVKNYNIGASKVVGSRLYTNSLHAYSTIESKSQCYKIFYDRNLRMLVLGQASPA
jgi:hypothetical protein